jgi:hypothetical protein
MSRYVSFVGKRVEAQYRVANIHQKSVGMLVADTGRCIVIEEHLLLGERKKTMRVEIPYEYVIRLADTPRNRNEPIAVHPVPPKVHR